MYFYIKKETLHLQMSGKIFFAELFTTNETFAPNVFCSHEIDSSSSFPSKHSSWWRCLSSWSSEEVLKTSSRRLHQDEYIPFNHSSSEDVFKMSSGYLDQNQNIRLGHTSSRGLHHIFKTSCKDVFKTLTTVYLGQGFA